MNKDEISKEIEATESRLRALREKLNAPVEKEYRAGEWVPECGDLYYYVFGIIDYEVWDGDDIEKSRLSQGNVYPTEAIAEAAKRGREARPSKSGPVCRMRAGAASGAVL